MDAVASLSVVDDRAVWTGEVPAGVPTDGDPLQVLGAAWRALKGPRLPGLPPLTGGFVGYLGYDVVRRIETLPDKAVDDLGLPELTMLLVTDLAAVDHFECTVVLIANAIVQPAMTAAELDAAYADALRRLDAMQAALDTPSESTVATVGVAEPKEAVSRTPTGQYRPSVELALEAIRAGEVFQIQVGQRFGVQTSADPLDVYRVLRTLNPSPYMYFLRTADVDIVGCSPEALVTVTERQGGAAPDRRHPQARRDRRARRRTGRRTGQRPEGAGRARHAGRPGPQRPRAGVRAGHGARSSSSGRSSATATSGTSSRRSRPASREGKDAFDVLTRDLPGRHADRARRRCGRWSSSTSSSRSGAACTAGRSATSMRPATSTWPSRSAPR